MAQDPLDEALQLFNHLADTLEQYEDYDEGTVIRELLKGFISLFGAYHRALGQQRQRIQQLEDQLARLGGSSPPPP